eukprot:m.293185 g.293185  ORF g.293185 m.293185 type:complete len:50 (-) comp16240_c0_seq5:2203-2352(-)
MGDCMLDMGMAIYVVGERAFVLCLEADQASFESRTKKSNLLDSDVIQKL